MRLKKEEKIGRNLSCPCGSGKKYKKCCLIKEWENLKQQQEIRKIVEEAYKTEEGKQENTDGIKTE